MRHTPAQGTFPVSVHVTTIGRESLTPAPVAGAFASAASGAAGRVYYYPIVLPEATVVRRLFWANGSTVGTNSHKVGIYSDSAGMPGSRLVEGNATLSAGTTTIQYDDITDVALQPGRYWLAFVSGGTTDTTYAQTAVTMGAKWYEAGSGTTLPATASASLTATTTLFIFGFTSRQTP